MQIKFIEFPKELSEIQSIEINGVLFFNSSFEFDYEEIQCNRLKL